MIWANFGDFGDFDIDFKILKKSCKNCYPILGQIFENFDFEFWWNRKVMINHRGGILFFCQILSKMKILDFRVKDFKFWILGVKDFKFRDITNFVNFGKIFFKFVTKIIKIQKFVSKLEIFVLGLRISNIEILGFKISEFQISPNSKFYKNRQILSKKFLISQILWVLGGKSKGKGFFKGGFENNYFLIFIQNFDHFQIVHSFSKFRQNNYFVSKCG